MSKRKNEDLTHFTPEYIKEVFGLPDKVTKEEPKEAVPKPTFKDYSQIIPPHMFKKPKKREDYYQAIQKTISNKDKDSNTIDEMKSLTEFKDNSSFLQTTPKMTGMPNQNQGDRSTQKKFIVKKKIPKDKTYDKDTICFSAKIVKKASDSSQNLPNESTVRKPSFGAKEPSTEEIGEHSIKARVNTEERKIRQIAKRSTLDEIMLTGSHKIRVNTEETAHRPITKRSSVEELLYQPVRKSRDEKAQTMTPKNPMPIRNFVIRSKNEVQSSNRAEIRTSSEMSSSVFNAKKAES